MAITDLTNTKWLINSTACPAGYGEFYIDFNTEDFNGYNIFFIGYTINGGGETSARASTVVISFGPEFLDSDTILTITGGTDVTNSDLISWLQEHATQIIEPEKIITSFSSVALNGSTLTINGKSFSLSSTSSSGDLQTEKSFRNINIVDNNDTTYTLMIDNNSAVVEKYSDTSTPSTSEEPKEPTLISFTINNFNYQAEDGMTWADWVNSEYNTSSFMSNGTSILTNSGSSKINQVSPEDLIVEDTAYVLVSTGSPK